MKQNRRKAILAAALILLATGGSAHLPATSKEFQAYFAEGVALEERGDLRGAQAAYEKAVQAQPDRFDALANLGMVHLKLGQTEQAIEYLHRTIAINPDLPAVQMYLGLALFQQGDYQAAESVLEKLTSPHPARARALHLLGLSRLKLNSLEGGITALEESLRLEPNNVQASYTLATAYIGARQLDDAEALLNGPLASLHTPEVQMIRGSILIAREEFPAAIEVLTRAKQADGELGTVHSQLGYAYMRVGENDLAMDEFRRELRTNPSDFNANAYLGWLSLKEQQLGEAAIRISTALRQRPGDTGLLYVMAQVHQANGEHSRAAELLAKVVEERPSYTAAHVVLARSYAKLKRLKDFARQRAIIRRLNEAEQIRSLEVSDSYGGREEMPSFSDTPRNAGGPR